MFPGAVPWRNFIPRRISLSSAERALFPPNCCNHIVNWKGPCSVNRSIGARIPQQGQVKYFALTIPVRATGSLIPCSSLSTIKFTPYVLLPGIKKKLRLWTKQVTFFMRLSIPSGGRHFNTLRLFSSQSHGCGLVFGFRRYFSGSSAISSILYFLQYVAQFTAGNLQIDRRRINAGMPQELLQIR